MKHIIIFSLLFLSTPLFSQVIVQKDLEIEQMVKEVSPDSLQSYIRALVAMGTRNTLSNHQIKIVELAQQEIGCLQNFRVLLNNHPDG